MGLIFLLKFKPCVSIEWKKRLPYSLDKYLSSKTTYKTYPYKTSKFTVQHIIFIYRPTAVFDLLAPFSSIRVGEQKLRPYLHALIIIIIMYSKMGGNFHLYYFSFLFWQRNKRKVHCQEDRGT